MSVADKIIQLKDDFDSVYDKGVSDGKQSQYDEFWDVMQKNGTRKDYNSAFCSSGWTKDNFKPKYDIVIEACNRMFYQFNYDASFPVVDLVELLKEIGRTMSFGSKLVTCYQCFSGARISRLGEIDVTGIITQAQLSGMFNTKHLVTIDKLIVCEENTLSGSFTDASGLENIEIEGFIGNNINFQWSKLLNRASIESIIKHLSTTQGATLTLSAEAVNREFPREGEWETFLAENKPSVWTINLL